MVGACASELGGMDKSEWWFSDFVACQNHHIKIPNLCCNSHQLIFRGKTTGSVYFKSPPVIHQTCKLVFRTASAAKAGQAGRVSVSRVR